MRQELPLHPHIDHLKKQAKDLLDAYRRGDPQAAERFASALPSYRPGAVLALHDAQSAIAREYSFASWAELRAEIVRRGGAAPEDMPDDLARALADQKLPEPLKTAVITAYRARPRVAAAMDAELPPELPMVPVRNALLVPGTLVPIDIKRPTTFAAIATAAKTEPPTIAVFAQRSPDTETPDAGGLHPIGVQALVHERIDAGTHATVVLEGLRWISLLSIQGHMARVAPVDVDPEDAAGDIPGLFETLRDRARKVAATYPNPDQVIAAIDAIADPGVLADQVVVRVPGSVEDKARYAAERRLTDRLRAAIAMAESQLTSPSV